MERLIVPVYLNQKLVFDLLAMLQDGISTVKAINTVSGETSSQNEKLSVGFGLSEAFSTLLKIDLSDSQDKNKSDTNSLETNEEKVHTPASLFFKLRNLLIEKNYLLQLSGDSAVKAGDFIEFEGSLSRNPIVETVDSMAQMMEIAEMFDKAPKQLKGKGGQNNEYKVMRQQMLQFSDSLKAGNTTDLTIEGLQSGHNALITVETAFLNDPQMSDLVDGNFRVLGKVIRSVGENDKISLLRKTAMSKMPSPVLMQAFETMAGLGSEGGFNIPEIKWDLEGPAFQIIPVAIYA
ncbi:hypothetical protein VYI99_17955 [Vibrio cholerae]|uniref:DUF6414 family protein n=3 Tax=Vibrio cholerae TaxID=666 RepID=UPI0015FCB2D8|nr:hypothetical protein [Vibrio cholerae]MBA8611551.1 hypothetical protein [Vibrio cholerae]MBJ6926813.1 hypothetical protein [Vibrio cholerae]MED7818125.1 hypothetical protein [Vibrio cholerae]